MAYKDQQISRSKQLAHISGIRGESVVTGISFCKCLPEVSNDRMNTHAGFPLHHDGKYRAAATPLKSNQCFNITKVKITHSCLICSILQASMVYYIE